MGGLTADSDGELSERQEDDTARDAAARAAGQGPGTGLMDSETHRAVLVTDAVGKTYALPSALAAHLCDYQIAGMQWLFGAVHGAHRPGCFGGILSDDTGLGKTIQTVALVGTLVNTSSRHASSSSFQ